MTTHRIETEGLHCLCCRNHTATATVYILYPMDLPQDWMEKAALRYGISIIAVTGMDWNNDLTPWKAAGVPHGTPDFEGDAGAFIERFSSVTASVEAVLSIPRSTRRILAGVSLSGLFALWQWPQSELFHDIISLSGSFWYEGFMEWFASSDFSSRKGHRACFLLGDRESASRVKAFDSVGINTAAIVAGLQAQGVETQYDIVPGNHYDNPLQRLDRALASITTPIRAYDFAS